MTIPATNSKLLITQDWVKIYQSFPYSELQSYDFDTIRRVLISYLKENYPEDFNDFIESSEYIALVELIAYIGQNLSFRIDLNARENFLSTAQRRDSILQLSQLISYAPKRNIPASGLLKVSSIATSANVFDSTGINLANTNISWNDSTNPNWYQQFLSIMNSAMPAGMTFGTPSDYATIGGIATEQYIINSSNTDVPIYSFSKNINGTGMGFEVVPATFRGQSYVYEDIPLPGTQFKMLYQDDNRGSGSANTGFFALFKQGSLAVSGFNITNPVPNEVIGVNVNNINNTDTWLWQLSSNARYTNLWHQSPAVSGNNVIYNSLSQNQRNVYSITTRSNDQIDINFSDGSFGNLPNGRFQLFYRQSNGLTYTIKPSQMSSVVVTIPYIDKSGLNQSLTLILSLEYTVSNSAGPESNNSIKQNAPQQYYTQNRMITAEDYNIAPLTYTSNVVKIKSVNRISSGISKYFDLSDVSGKYSSTNIFCDDGILAKNTTTHGFTFKFNTINDIWAAVKTKLEPYISSPELKSYYLDTFRTYKPITSNLDVLWTSVRTISGQSQGYFVNNAGAPSAVGPSYSSLPNSLYYVTPGSLIKFTAPTTLNGAAQYFLPDGSITQTPSYNTVSYIWTTVQQVIGTGSNNGLGALADGSGPIVLTNAVPSGAIPVEVVPAFSNILTYNFEVGIVNLCSVQQNFGLRFDSTLRSWIIIQNANLNSQFSNGNIFTHEGDTSNSQLDDSWLVLFIWDPLNQSYSVTIKNTQYIFQSANETGFYVDTSNTNFDYINNVVVKDKITVLSVNSNPDSLYPNNGPMGIDYTWQIDAANVEPDGYVDPSIVLVSFYNHLDSSKFSQIINPDAFKNIVGTGSTVVINGNTYPGRSGLKFQYQHNPSNEVRIDPAKSNIIDVYMLTADYDNSFRTWLITGVGSKPLPPTSFALESNYAADLEPIKAVSDQIIYQPAKYKVLFGNTADKNLQATFKAVASANSILSSTDITNQILNGINNFFILSNWDFGKSFYFSELSTYIMNLLSPNITNFVIVPTTSGFGNLYEVTCQSNEIFISGATADNIQVISAATAAQLNISAGI
jgi:hypothetical protein